ncbi:glycosyl hydrolase [Reichenbachiella ulvae]|uniref:Glycosyl hydrolase n=1 Tax=Reichenbachiella ulvae TaxID=2980104 RepID=A0ABT3CT57_9BACT|nr:glycosyl hydrolase [Reichenbachiella ulvae]MCV9386655.1 glycosyl hydrolase [Reichenbachiella ulvae]
MIYNNKLLLLFFVILFLGCQQEQGRNSKLAADFAQPPMEYRPETWFHFMGNNISREGITLDLEAIKEAGLQGIHLFNKSGQPYPKVEQIKILSPEWEDMIRHTADECERLGLKFTMQNCPGWSMTGGPWVPAEEAQREVVETVYHFQGGTSISQKLAMDENYAKPEYDYQDITVLAFPTTKGDNETPARPSKLSSNNSLVPWQRIINPEKQVEMIKRNLPEDWKPYSEIGIEPVKGEKTWVKVQFDQATTVRSLVFPPIRFMLPSTEYPVIDVIVKVQAKVENELVDIAELKIPNGNWNDRQYDVTLAIPETTSNEFKLTFLGSHVLNPGYIYLSPQPRLHNHEPKAFRALRSLQRDVKSTLGKESYVDRSSTIDISDKMDEAGILTWDSPAGKWTVVRFGHVNMRRTNKPAVPEATGWEASKMDKIAIENHLKKGMIGNLMREGGPIAGGKLDGLLIDSWESYTPTWSMHSEDMFREFKARRGYELKPFLPATMGYIVDSPEITTKFLRDLRHTMDELYVENFFTHFATVAHEMGAEVYTEGAGGEVLPIDPMRYYGVADIPMTEFWYPSAPSAQNEYAKPIFNAASATHLYNKPKLAAEACTQVGVQWNEHPFSVKDLIDYNFAKGVNHLVFHTFSHTPQLDVYPGSSFGGNIGFPLVRQQTWWSYMSDWTDYLTRNQYLLQQGEYVADVLWYYGDHFERPPFDLDYFPEGYRFDYLNAEILQNNLSVEEGKIKAKDAGSYRVIMLRDSRQLMLSTIQKLKELVVAGAVILGDKPVDSPSLMDDENDLEELKNISDQLWGEGDSGVKSVGKGRVYWGKSIEEVLKSEDIQKDVNTPAELDIHWIHRETAEEDIYFVSSRKDEPLKLSVGFRIQNAAPEIWDAFTGDRNEALVWDQKDYYTNVAITLAPKGSAIVVFPKNTQGVTNEKIERNGETILSAKEGWYRMETAKSIPEVALKDGAMVASKSGTYTFYKQTGREEIQFETKEKTIEGTWKLMFEEGWDTPNSTTVQSLASLTDFENETIRHYSGTTTYTNTFSLDQTEGTFTLDLGEIHNIAAITCNGQMVGTRWASPFSFDVSDYVKIGQNEIEVKITNTWRNQLLYDRQRADGEKKTWTTGFRPSPDAELDKSGLIGPVRINRSIRK